MNRRRLPPLAALLCVAGLLCSGGQKSHRRHVAIRIDADSIEIAGRELGRGFTVDDLMAALGPYDRRLRTRTDFYIWDNLGILARAAVGSPRVDEIQLNYIGSTNLERPRRPFTGGVLVDGRSLTIKTGRLQLGQDVQCRGVFCRWKLDATVVYLTTTETATTWIAFGYL